MKILQINAVYNHSSTGRTCAQLQDYINNYTSHECKTAFCYGGKSEDGYIIGSKTDRNIHGFLSRLFGKQGYYSTGSTKKLIKYMDQYAPDIVHLRNLHGNYINLPVLFKYLSEKKIPVVVTLHDCWFYTGKCVHYSKLDCQKWQESCGNCPALKEGNVSWFFDKTEKLLNDKKSFFKSLDKLAFVGVSEWITDEVKKSEIGKNADIVKRIYNWIDLSVFKPSENKIREKYAINENDFVIMSVTSSWNGDKGLEDFVKLDKLLEKNQKIVLVGGKRDGFDYPDSIICIPATESINDLVDLYSMADVFVTFSRLESFGKTTAEALACGTPAVCYNSTANPELIGEGCGYVASAGNVEEVKKYIDTVMNNGKSFYSKNCVEYVRDNFDIKTCVEDYIAIYKKLKQG